MPVAVHHPSSAEHVGRLQTLIDAALHDLVRDADPARLYEPIRYVLAGQGKRLRPVLLLLAAELFDVDAEQALPAALAVEVFHNCTLVHDDIMDHAEERRGRATVHVAWDQDTAILVGDYLLALAYDLLARLPTPQLPQISHRFFQTVARLCEGQTLDKAFETRPDVTLEAYLRMIDCKTGALVQAALELGGMVGGASEGHLRALSDVGQQIGRAFQIQDDLLDLVADDARWGKAIGGDLMEGKKTFLLLATLERATGADRTWFTRIIEHGGLPAEEVEEARVRMERLGVLNAAREAVLEHSQKALRRLGDLPSGPAADALQWLVGRMQARLH